MSATIPLLREHGVALTTRQIADAAGVAEGTLFRVFDDKLAILVAAIAQALDPEPVVGAISRVRTDEPLTDVLLAIVEEIEVHGRDLRTVLAVAHELARTQHEHFAACRTVDEPAHGTMAHAVQSLRSRQLRAPEEIVDSIAAVLATHRDELRTDPTLCARILFSVATSTLQTALAPADQLTSRDIVEVFLDGVRARPATPEPTC